MAVDKLVDSAVLDAGLTSVANAIRTKGGTSAQLSFPNGMVQAVNDISTGITPTGTISITQNATGIDVAQYALADVAVPTGEPIEVSTDAAMSAVLSASNVGKCYKFTGTTGTYTNGDLYVVEESE